MTTNIKKIAALVFLAGGIAWGADYTVGPGGNYTSLEDLRDNFPVGNWEDGDTVTILPGTYNLQTKCILNFGGKEVTVKGSDANDEVRITGHIQLGHDDGMAGESGGMGVLMGGVGEMNFSGSVILGGEGAVKGGEGYLTGEGVMNFTSSENVCIGGNTNDGVGGTGYLTGVGEMNFYGKVLVGGSAGEGYGDGGAGYLTGWGIMNFHHDVYIGGEGDTDGTGTVNLAQGKVIMAGYNTMLLRGNGTFTLSGTGVFQSGITSGTGVILDAATINLNGGTLAFDMTNAVVQGNAGATTNLTVNGNVTGQKIGEGNIEVISILGLTVGESYKLVVAEDQDYIADTGTLTIIGGGNAALRAQGAILYLEIIDAALYADLSGCVRTQARSPGHWTLSGVALKNSSSTSSRASTTRTLPTPSTNSPATFSPAANTPPPTSAKGSTGCFGIIIRCHRQDRIWARHHVPLTSIG